MSKEIFIVAKETQGRSNPIVAALLYEYCSLAAHWYVRNVPVEDVFDITWLALEDYTSGMTMADCLRGYGLDSIIPSARQYIDKVATWRRHHTHEMPAPETSAFFKIGKRSDSTFGIQTELQNLGGSWNNFLEYVRVWAFLMRDWRTGMKVPVGENTTRTFKKFIVSLAAPGVHSRLRLHLPVWGWESTLGRVRSIYLGLLVSNGMQDAIRFYLVNNSDLVGDSPWPDGKRPFVYALDRVTGGAEYMNAKATEKHALGSVMPMYRQARMGPNLLPAAFREHQKCLACGYRKMCFGAKDNVIPEAISVRLLQEDKRERLHLTGSIGMEPGETQEPLDEKM